MNDKTMTRNIGNLTRGLSPCEVRLAVTLLLLMVVGVSAVWGQTDYSGVYYIGSNGYDGNPANTNNYYLCPTEGWAFFVSDDTNPATVTGTDNGKPFLTTYRCKTNNYHSGDPSDAKWTITKIENSDYYYIQQTSTGRYMVSNGAVSSNPDRARVHLETISDPDDLDEKAQFAIYIYSGHIVIKPIGISDGTSSAHDDHDKHKWLTVNQGNQNTLAATSARTDGPSGFANTGGIVCLYTENDARADFYLETISPTIGYNSSGQVVISHPSATTFYYTLDGSNPTTNSTPYTGPISLSAGITTVKAIAVYPSNAASNPTTFLAFYMDGSHSYLIQSKEFDYYYMIPNLSTETANSSQDRLTTNSLARPSMQWYFEDAGMDNGVQYYYIKNLATGSPQYVYYLSSDNTIRWNAGKVTTDAIVDDAYKFSFVESTYGGYTIRPKLKQTYWLRKGGGCKSNNNIDANGSNEDKGYSRWTFMSYNGSVPNTTAPITASVGENIQYYKIASEAEPTYFIVTPTSPATVVTTTTTQSESTMWYFEEVTHDDWLTYYYIRNAKSNEYLYLKQTGNNALEMKATPTNDGKCYFAIAKSATDGLYIVPQSIKYNGARVYYSLCKKSDATNVSTANARWWNDTNGNDNVIKWIFTETALRCTTPVIAYSSEDNGYVITGANSADEKIYYTTNGDDPTISSSLEYDGSPILMSSLSEGTVIKAIVARNEDETTISEMASVTIEKVATPTITINADNSVTIACETDGATIYYKTGGDDPTTANAIQSASIASILPSQGPIKAFAAKDGWIHSSIATESNIPAKTITVSSSNGALTSEDPIVYNGSAHQPAFTIKDGETTISSEEYTSAYSDNTNAGTATITITDKASGDYDISGSFTFTIAQKALTITAKDKEITYGDEPANEGVEYDGFIEGEGENTDGLFTGTLSYAYNYTQYGDVGDAYTITPSGLTATNYDITFVAGTLTVNKREVGIEWGNTDLGYNGSEQVPTATVTNVVNNDEIGVTVTGGQTDVGEYTATATGLTGAKAGNYQFPSSNPTTTFSIGPGTFTPIVSIEGWTYGGASNAPSVSGNTSGGDETYTYSVKGEDNYSATVPENAGEYTVKVTIAAKGNYESAEATTDFTISPKSIGDGTDAAAGFDIKMTQVDNDVEVTHVKDGTTTLVKGADYTVSIEEQGVDHIVTVTGIGNYGGSVQGLFVKAVFKDPDGNGTDKAAAVYQASSDLANPDGITPYIVRKVNPSIGTMTITPVTYIPKDVPVLMLRTSETTGFLASPKEEATPAITDGTKNSNLLKVAPKDGVKVEAAQIYTFYMGEFVLTKKGTLSEGKFYIYNPDYTATPAEEEEQQQGGGNAPSLGTLRFVIEEESTGIVEMSYEKGEMRNDSAWYTLDGRKLNSQPTKAGLYIKNGRKTVIKRK